MSDDLKKKLPPEADWTDTPFSLNEFRRRIAATGKSSTDYSSLKFALARHNPRTISQDIINTHRMDPSLTAIKIAALVGADKSYVKHVCKTHGIVLPR